MSKILRGWASFILIGGLVVAVWNFVVTLGNISTSGYGDTSVGTAYTVALFVNTLIIVAAVITVYLILRGIAQNVENTDALRKKFAPETIEIKGIDISAISIPTSDIEIVDSLEEKPDESEKK